jgi:hypothetical protein
MVEVTEVTREDVGRRGSRLRRFRSAHPNVVAWVLPFAAFLFGVTLSAVGFVGIWRHTASEANRAHSTANAATQRLSQTFSEIRRLHGKLGDAHSGLAAARFALARARSKDVTLAAKLAAAERTNSLIAARLPGELAAVDATARSLARQSSSLASDLSGLESYLAQGGSSADPAFLKLQIQYVIRASSRVQGSAALLERQVGATLDTASRLSKPH